MNKNKRKEKKKRENTVIGIKAFAVVNEMRTNHCYCHLLLPFYYVIGKSVYIPNMWKRKIKFILIRK